MMMMLIIIIIIVIIIIAVNIIIIIIIITIVINLFLISVLMYQYVLDTMDIIDHLCLSQHESLDFKIQYKLNCSKGKHLGASSDI